MFFKGARCVTFIEEAPEQNKNQIFVFNNKENFDRKDLKNPLDINLKR